MVFVYLKFTEVHCEAYFLGVQVTGATLGITGTDSIGCKIAQRYKAFEMKIFVPQQDTEVKTLITAKIAF